MSRRASSEQYMRVQVMRNLRERRIIYLECGKDFADLLLTLLTLPVGKILKLLSNSEAGLEIGIRPGIFNVHSSLDNLEETLLNVQKIVLSDPKAPYSSHFLCLSSGAAVHNRCLNPQCTNIAVLNGQLCDDCEYVTYHKCDSCHHRSNYNGAALRFSARYDGPCLFLHRNKCGHSNFPQVVVVKKKNTSPDIDESVSETNSSAKPNDLNQGFAKETVTFMIKEDLSIVKSRRS